MGGAQGGLLEGQLPDGFRYRADVITTGHEAALAAAISGIDFSAYEMRGVVARRRVAFFGRSYEAGGRPTPPMADFLLPLRTLVGVWVGVQPERFEMALVIEYPAGAAIGWHRDAPHYDLVAGVSLASACRMKLRPCVRPGGESGTRRAATHQVTLERRSAYLLSGPAREEYEHHIPAVSAPRYSITFRTLR